jgi:hypothetical protein
MEQPSFNGAAMVHLETSGEEQLTIANEAGRLLFAGQCDFIAAANNMKALPPVTLPGNLLCWPIKCWQILIGEWIDRTANAGANITNARSDAAIDFFQSCQSAATG